MSSINQTFDRIIAWIKAFYADIVQRFSDLTVKKGSSQNTSPEETDDQPVRPAARSTSSKVMKSKPIRRHGRQKVYRLKGYTTVAKVNRKRQAERQQRLLRRALLFVIVIVAIILMYNYINPFKNIAEWYRFIGVSSLSEIISGKTTGPLITTGSPETTIEISESAATTEATSTAAN